MREGGREREKEGERYRERTYEWMGWEEERDEYMHHKDYSAEQIF
jgi:hypothetical protein